MLATIKKNSSGSSVKVAQYLTGYASRNKASDKFDSAFQTAVKNWQKKYSLDADGIIGPKTWRVIAEKAPLCTTSKNKTSAATCALQILLGGLTVDGIFGTKTKSSVSAFQAANGLEIDGKCGAKTWGALICGVENKANAPTGGVSVSNGKGTITPIAGKFQQPPDYKQYDSKWGSIMYSNHGNKKQTIKSSGCGPTAMANIVAALKDKSVTPPILADFSVKNGHRSHSGGTAWSFFKDIAEEYGFSKFVQTSSLSTAKACLDSGGYVVASMGPGYWTSGGHFITLWKYDSTYIYANDPASSSRKKQKQSPFLSQRKQFFCFWQ